MLPVEARTLAPEATTEDVEALLNPAEPDGTFRDTAECAGAVLLLGLLLLSPQTPRPGKG